MPADDVAAADRLDRYWDDVVRRGAVHPGGLSADGSRAADELGSDLALAVRRLHAEDDAPAPDRRFAARLGRELGLTATDAPDVSAARATGERAALVRLLAGTGLPLPRLAAAAILLGIVGGRLFGFGEADVPVVTAGPSTAVVGTAVGAPRPGGDGCGAADGAPLIDALDPSVTPTALAPLVVDRVSTAPAPCRPAS